MLEQVSGWLVVLVALSGATECLVEIAKSFSKSLGHKGLPNSEEERKRRGRIHVLSAASGVITALLFGQAVPEELMELLSSDASAVTNRELPVPWLVCIGLGILASRGSAFWSSVRDRCLRQRTSLHGRLTV